MYISINPTIYKQINKISPKEKSVKYKNPEERKNKILIYGTLVSLASLAIGGFTYKALKKKKHKIPPFDYTSARGEIDEVSVFIKKLPIEIQNIIKTDFDDIILEYQNIFKHLQSDNETEKFRLLFAIIKNHKENLIKPTKIISSNIDDKIMFNLMQETCSPTFFEIKKTKYTKGFMKEFMGTLNEFTELTQKEYKNNKKYTFLIIEKYEDFFADLETDAYKIYKEKYNELLEFNNNITYVIKNPNCKEKKGFDYIKLTFKDSANKLNFSNKHNFIEDYIQKKEEAEKIYQTFANGKEPDLDIISILSSLLKKSQIKTDFLLKGDNIEINNKIIEALSIKTGNKIEKLDITKNASEILNLLKQKEIIAQELYERNATKTFIYFDNFDMYVEKHKNTPELKNLLDYLKECISKEYFANIFNIKKNTPDFIENKKIFKIDSNIFKPQSISINKLIEKFEANKTKYSFVEYFHDKYLENHYISLLLNEKVFNKKAVVTNGILLYGENDAKIESALRCFINCCDFLNYKKITFNKENAFESIQELIKYAKEAEEIFKKTNTRTLIELENLDEILTNTTSKESLKMIARFKGLVERLSEDFHTTVITKTSKPLSSFEEASLATHRFGIQYEIK